MEHGKAVYCFVGSATGAEGLAKSSCGGVGWCICARFGSVVKRRGIFFLPTAGCVLMVRSDGLLLLLCFWLALGVLAGLLVMANGGCFLSRAAKGSQWQRFRGMDKCMVFLFRRTMRIYGSDSPCSTRHGGSTSGHTVFTRRPGL